MADPNFEVNDSGTHRVLTEQQLRIETVKALLQLIVRSYPASAAAHQLAEAALTELINPTEP
jgi:hypothetical protein